MLADDSSTRYTFASQKHSCLFHTRGMLMYADGQACPTPLKRKETRIQQCNMLACPEDCCMDSDCPFLADLVCNATTCHPFLNMTLCEYPEPGTLWFGSTVQGREVRWTFGSWRSQFVKLLDQETGIESINKLNKTATFKSEQAVCQCLQDFSLVILRKKFNGSCLDFNFETHEDWYHGEKKIRLLR